LGAWCNGCSMLSAPDEYTRMIIDAFRHWRWTPVCSQFPIFSETVGVFTFIDLLMNDEAGNMVVVEIKTGYDLYAGRGSNHMNWPLEQLSNAPIMQHALQVLIAEQILVREYNVHARDAVVVTVTRAGVTRRQVDKHMRVRVSQIWDALREHAGTLSDESSDDDN